MLKGESLIQRYHESIQLTATWRWFRTNHILLKPSPKQVPTLAYVDCSRPRASIRTHCCLTLGRSWQVLGHLALTLFLPSSCNSSQLFVWSYQSRPPRPTSWGEIYFLSRKKPDSSMASPLLYSPLNRKVEWVQISDHISFDHFWADLICWRAPL